MENERRRLARLPGPFDGRWNGASGGHHCLLTNVNIEGCFISFIGFETVGAPVTVIFSSDAGNAIEMPAVVRSVDPGIGFEVQFVEPLDDERRRLTEWLAKRGLP